MEISLDVRWNHGAPDCATGAEPGPGQPLPLREMVQGIVAERSVRHKRATVRRVFDDFILEPVTGG